MVAAMNRAPAMRRICWIVAGLALLLPAAAAHGSGSVGDDSADAVWGQTDMISSGTCPASPSAITLCNPSQSAVDSAGNLWVAELGNNRILMYAPGSATAVKVLGQGSFTTRLSNNGGATSATGLSA